MTIDRRRIVFHGAGALAVLVVTAALAVGCAPEPGPGGSPSATPSVSPRPGGPTPSPIETELPDAGFEVPGECAEIYSPAMLSSLEADNPPLNDPGVTMLSTQVASLSQIIDESPATLRCSWGAPGEYGLATNVTAVDSAQAELIGDELVAQGMACEPLAEGTICRFEEKGVTLDDAEYATGETHYLGGGAWVATSWINFSPVGYTEDIVASLWG